MGGGAQARGDRGGGGRAQACGGGEASPRQLWGAASKSEVVPLFLAHRFSPPTQGHTLSSVFPDSTALGTHLTPLVVLPRDDALLPLKTTHELSHVHRPSCVWFCYILQKRPPTHLLRLSAVSPLSYHAHAIHRNESHAALRATPPSRPSGSPSQVTVRQLATRCTLCKDGV